MEQIFQRLWKDYTTQNPSTQKIHDLFRDRGENVINDHIAFRTFNDPVMNVDVLAKPFLEAGYVPKGEYSFSTKHLFARHYEMPGMPNAPRVFISELMLEKFSPQLRSIVRDAIESVDAGVWESELIFAGNVFGTVYYDDYEKLRTESEYAAWLYVHGFRANHFTVSVNNLNTFKDIEEVNEFLKDNGFLLNSSGGEVKGSREQLLKQSSTMAEKVVTKFRKGIYEVPACYYEFAERFEDSEGRLFSGFIADSADKIFESTDFYKK